MLTGTARLLKHHHRFFEETDCPFRVPEPPVEPSKANDSAREGRIAVLRNGPVQGERFARSALAARIVLRVSRQFCQVTMAMDLLDQHLSTCSLMDHECLEVTDLSASVVPDSMTCARQIAQNGSTSRSSGLISRPSEGTFEQVDGRLVSSCLTVENPEGIQGTSEIST